MDLNNNSCVKCPKPCYTCANETICKSCKYEYNNICLSKCPNDTYILEGREDYKCLKEAPYGYYLDKDKEVYKKCYESCKKCYFEGNRTNHNCIECKENFTFYNNSISVNNCYENCDYFYYFDILNEFHCNETCPNEYNKTLINSKQCVDECKNIDIYKYEYNNTCYQHCPNYTYIAEHSDNYKCFSHHPDGYYLDKENETYKRCYETCNKCDIGGNETYHNCVECKDNYIFYNNSFNISNCYEKCDYFYYFDILNEYHCNKTCPFPYNKLILNKKMCIDNCKNDDTYIYEYNNTCYQHCPNNTYIVEDSEDYKCFSQPPDGYYFDKENKTYKKCYETCNKCDIGGNGTYHNCLECKDYYQFYTNSENITNCYVICIFYYYFDKSNEYNCVKECPEEYSKIIEKKKKCIDDCKNDDIFIYEYNNTCYQENQYETEVKETINIIKDKRDIEIEKFREMISDFNLTENKEDIIKKEDNVQYQMTTSDNQKNNTNKNMSTIDLGDCEKKLKDVYDIDPSLPLIIFKIDYFAPDTLIPIIGYEIYHPITKEKLNLSHCEDILIKLNIPVNIDEDSLFKYDPNSEFYNDNCFTYTTENGTDIILTDRKQEFADNNLSLCENNCNYTGYNEENKQSSCDCNIKNKMDLISEIIENPNKLSNNFESEESGSSSGASNIISIKCTKALFSKDGLKNNYQVI